MKRFSILVAAIAALLVAGSAFASDRTAGEPGLSAFALPVGDFVPPQASVAIVPAASRDGEFCWVSGRRVSEARVRPRRRERDREYRSRREPSGFSQLHGGFFDPDGDLSRGVLFGVRGGTELTGNFQLGLGVDWNHRSDRQSAVVQQVPLPGGGTAERRMEIARSSSDLLPIMAFLQFTPEVDSPVLPYFGIGGGYEVLFLSADDFETGEKFDATYGGWGWQVWGGLALPLAGRSRLTGEVFVNTSDVERDVNDPETGEGFREIIDMGGVGGRFGLSWGF